MTQSTSNPFTLPQDLNDAERKLAYHLGDGTFCRLEEDGIPEKPIEFGEDANVIRGPVLGFFACGGNAEHPVQGRSIRLGGAWITGYPESDFGLDLVGANILCRLDFRHCHFADPVKLQRSHCAEILFTDCRFADSVNMEYAKCAEVGIYESHMARGLAAERLATEGDMYLHAISTKGEVRLLGASIGEDLSCRDGTFYNPGGCALNAESAKIGGRLTWRKMSGDGFVNLGRANADVLDDDMEAWKPFNLVLDGFTYNQFAAHADAESRIKWLAGHSDGGPLSLLPYEQAAKVLRSMGKDIDAWDIEREKKRLQREADGVSWIRKCGGWIVDTLQDAVYRPLRTVRWALSVMAIGAVVFALADYHGHIVPTHPVVTLSEDYRGNVAPHGDLRPTQAVPPEYPAFNPVAFSLDVFTPSAVFRQEDSWGPRSGGGDWWSLGDFGVLWLLTPWYWFQIAAGWILIPLFLLSITGLLRPRQSSGEKG